MNIQQLCGWVPNPIVSQNYIQSLPHQDLYQAAPHLIGFGDGKIVVLQQIAKKVLGSFIQGKLQKIGCCVSMGWSTGTNLLQVTRIAKGEQEEFKPISHAAIYGLARARGGMLGGDDGLVGAYAAQSVNLDGTVSNQDAGDSDTDDTLAKKWGDVGCPSNIKTLATQHLVLAVAPVTTPEQARDAITSLYPVPVCSQQGFSMTRDSGGRCVPKGSWAHCMCWTGYRDDKKQFLVEQSWGPDQPDGPIGDIEIPNNSFWIDWDVAARMLRQNDSFVPSSYKGFPAQILGWLI